MAVLIVAWAVPVIALNAIENKHTVEPRELILDNPAMYPVLQPLKWTNQKVANAEGVYARSWVSGKVRLFEQVHRYGSSISATYAFSTRDPLFSYERATKTSTTEPPSGLRADQAEIFCADFISKRGFRDKCFAWGAWLRYGQYTVYVAITNVILSGTDFASITRRADSTVNRALL